MANAPSYPLFLNLAGQAVLIVGGGAVALRKARGLAECEARVTVVSPQFTVGFDKFTNVDCIVSSYAALHIKQQQWRLVFAATDDHEINAMVGREAAAAGILCCRCDDPEEGDFSGGAIARLGEKDTSVTIAISTGGASPGIAKQVGDQAAAAIDPVLIKLVELLSTWRGRVKDEVVEAGLRRALLERLSGEEMQEILRKQGPLAAQRLFERWLDAAQAGTLTAPRSLARRGETFGRRFNR